MAESSSNYDAFAVLPPAAITDACHQPQHFHLLQVFISLPPAARWLGPLLTYGGPSLPSQPAPPASPTHQSRVSAAATSPHPAPKSRIRVLSGGETRSARRSVFPTDCKAVLGEQQRNGGCGGGRGVKD